MLDDLAGLRRDPVGEEHLELHHQVAPLRRALGHGQAFAPQPPNGPRLDDVAARQGHHAVVKSRDVDGAAAESLQKRQQKRKEGKTGLNEFCTSAIFRICFVRASEWPD